MDADGLHGGMLPVDLFNISMQQLLLSSTYVHRCLQSCVGTWAKLGYAAFDAQLRILSLHCTLYVCLCMHMLVTIYVSLRLVLVI